MPNRIHFFLPVVCLLLLVPLVGSAQQAEPTVYTFVAAWSIPRPQWEEFTGFVDKNFRPVLERRFADGTIVGWGSYGTIVHEEDGFTHGISCKATSIASIERVREELIRIPPSPAMTGAKHRDWLLDSLIYRSRPASGSGYLWVSTLQVQSGKGKRWLDVWDKYTKALYDELLAEGTVLSYEVYTQTVRTDDPGMRYVVFILPNAEAADKVGAAFRALIQRNPEEYRTTDEQLLEAIDPASGRDFFARIVYHAQK